MSTSWKSPCRNCNHEGHLLSWKGKQIINGCCDTCAQDAKYCATYVPLDNLEYLEWKHDKKLANIPRP